MYNSHKIMPNSPFITKP